MPKSKASLAVAEAEAEVKQAVVKATAAKPKPRVAETKMKVAAKPPVAAAAKSAKPKEAAVEKKLPQVKEKRKRSSIVDFTPQSRKNGKRAPGDHRPRRVVEEEDEDDDEDEDEDEEDEALREGGVETLSSEDDGAQEQEDETAITLMASSRRQRHRPAAKGGGGVSSAAVDNVLGSESEADVPVPPKANAPKRGRGASSKKAQAQDNDGVSIADEERQANAKKHKRAHPVPVAAAAAAADDDDDGGADDSFDIDMVLRQNAKKWNLHRRKEKQELSSTNVFRLVESNSKNVKTVTKFKLVCIEAARKCFYTKKQLLEPNRDGGVYRIDATNFLYFVPYNKNGTSVEYGLDDVCCVLVDKDGVMHRCDRKFLLTLFFLDFNCDYELFRKTYNGLPEHKRLFGSNGEIAVPPGLYTKTEITKSQCLLLAAVISVCAQANLHAQPRKCC